MMDGTKTNCSDGRHPNREADAIAWHVLLHSGNATRAERLRFAQWRDDRENHQAYAEIEALWASLDAILETDRKVLPFRRRWGVSLRTHWPIQAIAASLLAIIACGYQYARAWQYDYVAQGADRRSAVLADGTRITLNTGAALNIRYSKGVRDVQLARGEVFFDVYHNAARPFVVHAGGGEVRVLGTAFSVSRDGDRGRVVVLRGKVRVKTGKDVVFITPNQSVTFADSSNGAVANVDAPTDVAWSSGRLFLKNKPLREVIATLGRYYPGAILLINSGAAEKRINATINLDNIDEWLAALGRSQHIRVRNFPGLVLLS